jgi:hypothetical protein
MSKHFPQSSYRNQYPQYYTDRLINNADTGHAAYTGNKEYTRLLVNAYTEIRQGSYKVHPRLNSTYCCPSLLPVTLQLL